MLTFIWLPLSRPDGPRAVASGGRQPLACPLRAVEQQGRHHDAVDGLVAAGTGRGGLALVAVAADGGLGRGGGLFTAGERVLVVAGAGERAAVEGADVDPVVEQHAVAGPCEAVDQVDPALLALRYAGERVEGPHGLAPLEHVGGRTLRHAVILPNHTGRARIRGESFAELISLVN